MIKEIQAKSILRKHKRIDSWFLSRYGMNLYRGCTHNCAYCDGRAEGYYVSGEFGSDIEIKVNAIEVLKKELSPARKRTPFEKGFAMVGGGVCDGYQPVEAQYELSRKTLEVVRETNFPVHLLTKSTLIKRDIELINDINRQSRAIVSFSFSSCNDDISKKFEPGIRPPSERLEVMRFFKDHGIATGMFLMPVIPYVTDLPQVMEDSVAKAKEAGADFIIFSGMTLKPGRQQDHFYNVLDTYDPQLKQKYEPIYPPSKWGGATEEYYNAISLNFHAIARKYNMPVRIPLHLFKDILNENDLVTVLLEHIDYLLKSRGDRTPYGFAAYSVAQLKEPISSMKTSLTTLKGVGTATEKIILEILKTGSSSYYERLMKG
jgi:DNA repair photolyase